ncbi:MAG: hypothetical protein AAFP20_14610 [Cyanobacteria bacterium J06614_10]
MANTSNLSFDRSWGRFNWTASVLLIVTFWLSSSVLLDFLFMPMMYESGMMNDPSFASSGYSLFWLFNRVELLCAATVLTGLLVLRQRRSPFEVTVSGARSRWALLLGGLLFAIALTYTYLLTPHMSALGLNLSGSIYEPMPRSMPLMHLAYWALEALKLAGAGFMMRLCYRDISGHTA